MSHDPSEGYHGVALVIIGSDLRTSGDFEGLYSFRRNLFVSSMFRPSSLKVRMRKFPKSRLFS